MEGNLVTIDELLVGPRLFDIPVYQRGYAWEEKNLQDIWEDLYYLDPSKKHYLGTALLKDSGDTVSVGLNTFKRLEVIDGQQRLTTVLILLREIISQANSVEELRDQVPELEKDYLKNLGYYKLNYKLTSTGSDDDFFRRCVVDGNEILENEIQTGVSMKRRKSGNRTNS